MTEKDIKALRDLTLEELGREEGDLRQELFNLRFQNVLGRVERPTRIRDVRRAIARVKTVSRQKAGS